MDCVTIPNLINSQKTGRIQVIFGPMFSGKTTELMRRMKRYALANYKCMIIKYANDTRYDENSIATHDSQKLEAVATMSLKALYKDAGKCDVIGVDEGQFFPDVVEFCEKMADQGKTVIVAALDGTFQRQGFGDILKLVPLAESVIKLTAVCMVCYGEASFTKRKGHETQLEVIGGTEMYLAVCRACYKPPCATSPMCSPARHADRENVRPIGDKTSAGRNLFASPMSDRTNTVEMEASS